jgi:hypothetical protein
MRKLTQYVLAAVAAVAVGAAFAGPLDKTTGSAGVNANVGVSTTLQGLDKDGDGSISKSEASSNKDLNAQFSKYDANHDGKLDSAEFAKFEAAGNASGNMGGTKSDSKSDTKSDSSGTKSDSSTTTEKPAKP